MAIKFAIDLHRLAKSVNIAIPMFAIVFLLLGHFSFYFHFLTVFFLLLSVVNFFYLFVQKKHALLRNFGILAQIRYALESLGPELRQYLYSSDTEERPFNRVERSEVYRKSLDIDSALSFGSQRQFNATEIKIRHSLYPLTPHELQPYAVTFGDQRKCPAAYTIHKPIIISAMSFGSLGSTAVRALARGAKRAGIPMNTGEGGFPKYHLMEGCDLIFQMGTAKFGVRNHDGSLNENLLRELAARPEIRMVEIKFSQGAKPGKGGLLPKEKITREISELRGVPMDRDVVSPPNHIECTDAASTVRFIRRVQEVAEVPVGIKMCLGRPQEFRALVEQMKLQGVFPDYLSIDGAEGGTGAAPKAFLDQVGVPLFPALHSVQQILVEVGTREHVKLLAAGKLVNAGRMLVAMALGAEACYTARGFMFSLGCIQAMQCGQNTCPVGITTHNPELQRGLDIENKAQRVVNFTNNLTHDFEQVLAATGRRSPRELSLDNLYIPDETALPSLVDPAMSMA